MVQGMEYYTCRHDAGNVAFNSGHVWENSNLWKFKYRLYLLEDLLHDRNYLCTCSVI